MVCRLAYFVGLYDIPEELVVNGDHTALHTNQVKGKAWIDPKAAKEKDHSIQNEGEKANFTLLAAGTMFFMLPFQVVMAGKTGASLPKFNDGRRDAVKYVAHGKPFTGLARTPPLTDAVSWPHVDPCTHAAPCP